MELFLKSKNIIVVTFFYLLLISCGSKNKLPVQPVELENITEGKLLNNVYSNVLEYNTIYSKKMEITLKANKDTKSFKAMMRIKRDSFIWVSMNAPLGIEVGRLLLTPDSIKFLNTYEKKYFIADYDHFNNEYDINLDYDYVQKMITNYFFSFESLMGIADGKNKKYKLDRTGKNYLLYTQEERAVGRKLKKLYKKKRKNKEFSLILQKIEINPDNFRPCSISLEDVDEQVGVSVSYHHFKDFDGKIFPEEMIFNFFSDTDKWKLDIIFNRLEFDVPVTPSFKIPAKYKRIE